MKQRSIDEFAYRIQLEKLSSEELEILKALENIPNGLKSRQIAGEILPKQHGKGGLSYRSGRELKPVLENLREKNLVESDGSKPHQWFLSKKGEKILGVESDG
ncbi:hypothetical protein AKJ66_01565 [candidate division MSBL1 archaeon SCGC-AAA259E22]|uniref:Transcription regulator TrmB N-terminal domain-containing protein n=1 Tax=candidate division MSBL1 archaeon SCGC-AAA259E22 TaxID=1698265 RepID=A0A133UHE9_9EURY|nr:hypothetical protein AKJ66_01565 [candidate division MSBL1 archaeon SCGC-AAA259E22]